MSTDLQKILYSKTKLTGEQMQYLVYQLLAGMNYINSSSVLHRDLKPSNLLIDIQTCNLQICDFGLARSNQDENSMTQYVVTRWYRAPELILLQRYTTAIDVWSFACIFAELLTMLPEAGLKAEPHRRKALFPGRSCFPLSPQAGAGQHAEADQHA